MPLSLPTPAESLNTSVNKKSNYVIVSDEEAKPKKKIVGNIGEQNVITGKRIKKQLKAYTGFLADVTKDQSLLAQKAAFYVGLIFHKKLHRNQLPLPPKN